MFQPVAALLQRRPIQINVDGIKFAQIAGLVMVNRSRGIKLIGRLCGEERLLTIF